MNTMTANDKIIMGFAEKHSNRDYFQRSEYIEGPLDFGDVRQMFDYHVEKVPLYLEGGSQVEGAFTLLRTDTNTPIFPMVGDRYVPVQNSTLLERVHNTLIKDNPDIQIESAGTMNNGQKMFLNLLMNEHQVTGDESPTLTRLMVMNSHGGDAVATCLHQMRMICMNMLAGIFRTAKTDNTLMKFKHTRSTHDRIDEHVWNLSNIYNGISERNEMMDRLAGMKVNRKELRAFLNDLIPIPEKEGSGRTMAENKQEDIKDMFLYNDDLQGDIHQSRFSLLQAVTDYSDHCSRTRGEADDATRYHNGIFGNQHTFKMNALTLITDGMQVA